MNPVIFVAAALTLAAPFSTVPLMVCLTAAVIAPGMAAERLMRGRQSRRPDALAAVLLGIGFTYILAVALNALSALTGTPLARSWVINGTLGIMLASGLLVAVLRRRMAIEVMHPEAWKVAWSAVLVMLPLLATVGAERVNRSGDGAVSVALLIAVAGVVAFSLWRPAQGILSLQIYSASTTVLLLGSMRGDFLSGIDMSREYYVYLLAEQAGHWSTQLSGDAFNSSLSVNVLARHLTLLYGVDPQYTFRILIPLLYALIPVMIASVLARHFEPRVGALGAAVFVAQPVFLEWSSIPARQMVAITMFTALVYFLIPADEELCGRSFAVALFGVLLVLSHYSTTYLSLFVLLLGSFVLRAFGWLRGHGFRSRAALSWSSGAVIVITALVWYGPVTQVGGNLVSTAKMSMRVITSGEFSLFGSSGYAPGTSLAHQLGIGGQGPDRDELFEHYQDTVEAKVAEAGYQPAATREDSAPVGLLSSTSAAEPTVVNRALGVTDTFVRMLMRLFMAVGLLVALRRLITCKGAEHEWAAYGVAAGVALALVVIVPLISIEYDVGRTTQHLMPLLALPIILGARKTAWAAEFIRLPLARDLALAVTLSLLFTFSTGLVYKMTGSSRPQMMTVNEGEMYEQSFVHESEIAAADWLKRHREPGVQVAAGYFSSTRLPVAGLPRPVRRDVFPWSVGHDDYLFRGMHEVTSGVAGAYHRGAYLKYLYPTDEIESLKSTVYANDYVRIYR